jgi:hypothetical protein
MGRQRDDKSTSAMPHSIGAGPVGQPSPDTPPSRSGSLRASEAVGWGFLMTARAPPKRTKLRSLAISSAAQPVESSISTEAWEQRELIRERHRRDEIWRQARLDRFLARQQRLREWINFQEIAEWCSELSGSPVADEAARATAYERLEHDLLAGDFEQGGRSRVLFLHARTTMARMTRERLRRILETVKDAATIRGEYLDHRWIPVTMYRAWCRKHHLADAASRFQPNATTKK